MKFYGGENSPEEELISRFEENGLAAGRLKRERRLLMRSEENPLGGREDQIGRLIEKGVDGGRTVWASFDWVLPVDLEVALEQQQRLADLVGDRPLVVKTATIDGAIEKWSLSALRRA